MRNPMPILPLHIPDTLRIMTIHGEPKTLMILVGVGSNQDDWEAIVSLIPQELESK